MPRSPRPDLTREQHHGGVVCGVDEAGRGPWAGPVVAAAVILNATCIPSGIHDSKKLTPATRERLHDDIVSCAHVGVGQASVVEIDDHNILAATFLAMRRAVEALPKLPSLALIDGNRAPALPCRAECIVQGDALSLSIAAASIIAKVTRDRIMRTLALEFPEYGFEKHAGYGTAFHQAALQRYGVTPHHRRSFSPIRLLLEERAHA